MLLLANPFTKKQLHRWLGGYARHLVRQRLAPQPSGTRHVLFALCDHWEPLWGDAELSRAHDRVQAWEERYPKLCKDYRDSAGNAPKHSFFFPGEQYRPEWLDSLASLAKLALGEVEFHLHHDRDTSEKLRAALERYLKQFAEHGHLSRDEAGQLRYGFIHGNWCLANSRDDGRWCGVDDEMLILHETGCYADFTFPSAPDECQPNIVNSIYWPMGDLSRSRAYESGQRAKVGQLYDDRLLMIEGPLALTRRESGLSLRIENGALTGKDPATPHRVKSWIEQAVHVSGRPEWLFVKVHTHGAPEDTLHSLLGDGGRALHDALAQYNDGERYALHYVSAREMYNIAIAAISGEQGDPENFRNYRLPPPPVMS